MSPVPDRENCSLPYVATNIHSNVNRRQYTGLLDTCGPATTSQQAARKNCYQLQPYTHMDSMWKLLNVKWYDYSKIGRVIPGTQFLACKTPLKMMLTDEERFTPEDLIELVKSLGKNLAMVIDLTNTTRYYNKDRLENISYAKIFTPGRVVPSPDIVSQFFVAVDSVGDKLEKDDVIAVHCTHGVNRTGYFICKYMVDKLKFSPEVAIDKFNTARGHNIERDIYLNNLKGVAECESQTKQPNKHYHFAPYNNQFIRKKRANSFNDEHYDQHPQHSNPKYPFSALNGRPYDKHYDRGPNQYRPGDRPYSAQNRQAYNEHYDDQRPSHYRRENSSFSWRNARPPQNEYYDRAYDYDNKNSPACRQYWSRDYQDYEYKKSPANHVSSDFESHGHLNHQRRSNRVGGYTNQQSSSRSYKRPKESWRNDGHW